MLSRPALDRHSEALITSGLALLSILFTVVCVSCLHVRYLVNDDTGIIGFVTGGYPVPYIGILFSSLLHLAYMAAPGIAWFGLALYALLTLSLFLWLRLVWRVFKTWWLAAACSLAVLGYYLAFIVFLDFTATSIMLCMAGISWACLQILERKPGWVYMLGPGFVFVLGILVRPQAALGTLAYALPIALIAIAASFRGRSWKHEAGRVALVGLVFFAPAILDIGMDGVWRHITLTPQEAQYEAFINAAGGLDHLSMARRGEIVGVAGLLESAHMPLPAYQHFLRWQFLDERIYTPEAIQTLLLGAPLAKITAVKLENLISSQLPPRSVVFWLLIASIPLFLIAVTNRPAEGAIGLLIPVYYVALTVFMYFEYAFVYRLDMPFEIGLGFSALLMGASLTSSAKSISSGYRLSLACLSIGVALVGASFAVRSVLDEQPHAAGVTARLQAELRILNEDYANSVILIAPHALDLNALSPLTPIDMRFQPINLGWNTFSPRFYRQIGALGIQHGYELMDILIDRPNAYILGNRGWCEAMLVYVSGYPQRKIDVTPASAEKLPLYRLTEESKP